VRRGLLLGIVIAAVVGAASVGWAAGRNIKSPAEIAAEAQPPEPSLITVAVESLELSADVITRADVGYDQPAALSLGGSIGGRPTVLVVTAAPEVGADLGEGSVAIEVSGRPVFLLEGEIPVYRDLRPGAEGPDVLQLEEALARLGFFTGGPDGVWDATTGEAVAAWFEASGYRPNNLTEEEEAQVDAARSRLRAAGETVSAASKALAEAGQGPTQLDLLSARSAVTAAEEGLELAQENVVVSAEAAEQQILDRQFDRDQAARAYTQAEARWNSAQLGVHPDTGDLLTPTAYEQLRLALELAERNLRDADRAVTTAYRDRGLAGVESQAAIRSAEEALLRAQVGLEELLSPPDVSALQRAAADARSELNAAQNDLSQLQTSLGVWIPAGELIFLGRLPVRIDRLSAARGSRVEGSFMTVTGSDLAIRGAISERDVALVREGTEVQIEDASLSGPISGVVTLVESQAGTRGVGPGRYYFEMRAEGIPETLIGSNVRIVIPVQSTEGEVLAVPAAALSATADGSSRVQVAESDGTRFVTVRPGLAAEGLVEVTPLDGELNVGDRVVVGIAS
jgi:multidrug efflux pump subunit AcrA (membrane-fusion protein)